MPEVYKKGDCDLAGFAVGLVDRRQRSDENVAPGMSSLGCRRAASTQTGYRWPGAPFASGSATRAVSGLGQSIGAELLVPTQLCAAGAGADAGCAD